MFHIGIATQAPPLPEPGQLSDAGIDFIERCLTLDPPERPAAGDLLYHPWLSAMVQHLVCCRALLSIVADRMSTTINPYHRPYSVPRASTSFPQTDYGAAENASPGGPSATSTLVDHSYDTQAYAAQMEEIALQQLKEGVEGMDLDSLGNTPKEVSPPAVE
jgi:serine/threonine protein kinase